jgi:branched-chain amino acid transport system ATP-binding protein
MTPVFAVERLNKAFGGLAVTQDVSLSLQPGDRVALIGPNGAGKTTFVNLVTGHLKPDAGKVMLGGADVTRASPTVRVRRGLVRSFQVTRLFADMTPQEHVALAVLQRQGRSGRMFGHFSTAPEVVEEAGALLATLGLEGVAGRRASEIAYGQQRLLEIALALATKPKVLLLDEPAAGVPREESSELFSAITSLSQDITVLFIEHDMELVFRLASRIIVMVSGGILLEGTPDEISADPRVREVYLGGAHG